MEVVTKFLKFFGMLGVFYGLPLLYIIYFNSKMVTLSIIFLLIYPLGYYFIYTMMTSDIIDFKLEPDDMSMKDANAQAPEKSGYLEQDVLSGEMSGPRIRIRTLGWGFLYHLIPFLLLMLLLLYLTNMFKYNEMRNLAENMGETITLTGDVMELIIKATDPDDLPHYLPFKKKGILNIFGQFDKAELVLKAMNLHCRTISAYGVAAEDLSDYKVAFLNCPGQLSDQSLRKLKKAVEEDGLWLFTTDWAIKYALQKITPGFVKPKGKTGNTLYAVTDQKEDHPFCNNLVPANSDPHWWVFYSFPIQVLKEDLVTTFLESKKLEDEFNTPSIAITYPFGKGRIVHIIGHFYQQVSSGQSDGNAYDFTKDHLNVTADKISPELQSALENIPSFKFKQAYSIMRLIANVLIANHKKATDL